MCGDWNVVENYAMDTMNYSRQNNPKSQHAIFGLMVGLNYSTSLKCKTQKIDDLLGTHNEGVCLNRPILDYFLVSSDATNFAQSIETLTGYRTDHSLVIINLALSQQQRGRGYWKFNNSLLYDMEYVKLVKKCTKETVEDYKLQVDSNNPESIKFSIR